MIAIKDMEMPKSCGECPMTYKDEVDYRICTIIGKNIDYGYANEIHPNCPLTEIHTCKDCISKQAVWFKLTNDAYDGETTEQFINRIAKEIESAPPVNSQPKTGHWIMTSDYFAGAYENIDYVKCSNCHEYSLEEGDYCPNCGCHMVEL